jgi:nucleotide-binding universal stress UspA family protein
VDTLVTNGSPVAEIARVAETQKASLLVVGAGSSSLRARLAHHRIGERLRRVAPCPLLVARPLPAKDACRLSPARQEALVE